MHDNIEAFGGDPANVTLFGESAGGLDILALMTAKRARGLFHKAIVQSGGGWLPATPLKTAQERGVAAATALGLTQPDAAALRALAPEQLTTVEGAFGPVIDGRLLDRDPISAFALGDFADVPMMIECPVAPAVWLAIWASIAASSAPPTRCSCHSTPCVRPAVASRRCTLRAVCCGRPRQGMIAATFIAAPA